MSTIIMNIANVQIDLWHIKEVRNDVSGKQKLTVGAFK